MDLIWNWDQQLSLAQLNDMHVNDQLNSFTVVVLVSSLAYAQFVFVKSS